MRTASFKLKLFLSYAFVILASFGFVAYFLNRGLEDNSLRNIKSHLINDARLIENQIPAGAITAEDSASLEKLAQTLSPRSNCRITIINTQGKVLAESEKPLSEIPEMVNHIDRPEVRCALKGETGSDIRYSSTLRINMLYVALPLKEEESIKGVLRLALPLESVQKTLSETKKTIIHGLLLALVLAFVLATVVAARTIKPINRMIQVSRKFAEGEFDRRITHFSRDEIGELAETLNQMAQDIENKIGEIKTQNQKLSAVFNSMIEGVIVLDRQGLIVSVNPAVEQIFNIQKDAVKGKVFLEAIRNSDIAEVINLTFKDGKSLSTEITLIYPAHRIFEVSATPIFNNDRVDGCLIVIHDITEIRRLETVRKDFVANVSHELKTPLTSIKGFVETLLEGALEDKDNNRNFLKIVRDHADRLNSLVDDLLSLSHLESKDITLQKESFDLKQEMDKVIFGFKSQSKSKNIDIKNELPANTQVVADKHKIEQVLTNIIDNAIKFNKDKGNIIIYSREADGKIKIIIEDSGIGIPEKDIPRIFERFYRVDKARSRQLQGTGLGLSIVKHIIELHNGNVGVESTEGLGSKFWFILPK